MQALILASGVGSRLYPLTKELPKALVRINTKTILDMEICCLLDYGIRDIIITTGYKAEKIKEHILSKYPNINITLVNNHKYNSTNYIYSLWLAREFLNDDLILFHGDMVFEESVFKKLINSPFPDAVLLNNKIIPPQKDFMAKVSDNSVKYIGVRLNNKHAVFCAPVYKLSRSSIQRWVQQIDLFVNAGNVTCYAEDAFNQISDEIMLRPIYFENEFCMEIDTNEDLIKAREYFKHTMNLR